VLIAAQVVNQVPVVVAKNRPENSWQLKLRDINAPISQSISDDAFPNSKLVEVRVLYENGFIETLISAEKSLGRFDC
jgi:hypothetical protein